MKYGHKIPFTQIHSTTRLVYYQEKRYYIFMKNKKTPRKININLFSFIMLSFLAAATIWGSFNFAAKNRQRIVDQNANYAFEQAKRVAGNVDQEMEKALKIVESYSYFIEHGAEISEINADYLKSIESESGFDLIRYINEDGVNLASDGNTSNATDRDYYIKGMKGISGTSIIFNSRIDNSTMIGFYSPLYSNGKVYGVIRGVYLAQEHLKDMLDTTFFNEEVVSYLCDADGRIIAGTGVGASEEANIKDISMKLMPEAGVFAKLSSVLGKKDSDVYISDLDIDSAYNTLCIVKLDTEDMYLVQMYPKSISLDMIRKANDSGFFMIMFIGLIILLNVIFFLVNAYRTNFELFNQNRDMGYIIEGISGMIEWFGMVDFETDSFRFLETNKFVFEKKYYEGEYHKFLRSFLDSMSDPNDEARLSYKFSKENIDKMLGDGLIDSFGDMFCTKIGNRDQWYRITVTCLEAKEEKVNKILFMVQDVTAIREADEQVKRELDNKEKALRLAAKERTEFILGLVEQINVPRKEIIKACEKLEESASKNGNIERIEKGVNQQGLMMESLCEIADIESGNINVTNREYDTQELVNAIKHMLEDTVSLNPLSYRVDLIGEIPKTLVGDFDHICQAVNYMIISSYNRTNNGEVVIDITSQRVDMDNTLLRINCVDTAEREEDDGRSTKWGNMAFYISKSLAVAMGGQGFIDVNNQKGNTSSIIIPQKVAFD